MSEISTTSATPVVVIGFDMPFWPLVRFLIKIAIASLPAGIVIASSIWWRDGSMERSCWPRITPTYRTSSLLKTHAFIRARL
jgi:hypothetical protein